MGVFEMEPFAQGTVKLAEIVGRKRSHQHSRRR
jgi:3-phosphoglycerate kinase